MKKKPTDKNRTVKEAKEVDPGSMEYWQGMAQRFCPGLKDRWQINELATVLMQLCVKFGSYYPEVSAVCDKTVEKCVRIGVGVELDRQQIPPEVSWKFRFIEAHSYSGRVAVPDPNVMELPLEVTKNKERDLPELGDDDEPRVRAGE